MSKMAKKITDSQTAMIAVSIVLLISIFSLSGIELGDLQAPITGFVTQQDGFVNASVAAITSLTMIDNFINIGSLSAGETNDSVVRQDYFNISNDGSVHINITAHGTSSPFVSPCTALPNYCIAIRCNTTLGGGSCNASTNYMRLPGTVATNLTLAKNVVLGTGSVIADVNITIPSSETGGTKTFGVTFTAVKNDTT